MSTRPIQKRWSAVLAASLIAVAGTSAALDSAANAAPAAPAPASCAPTPGIDAKTIKIGVVMPKTGPAAPTFAGWDQAVKLRLDQENAKGGINGRKFVVSVYDDQATPATQTVVASKAIEQDDVFGISEGTVADAMFPFLKSKNVPVIGLSALPPMGTDRNAFGSTGPYAPTFGGTAAGERVKQAGVTSMAVVAHNLAGAVSAAKVATDGFKLAGVNVPLEQFDLPQGPFDATSLALRMKNSGANGVYSVVYVTGAISIAQALQAQGVKAVSFIPGLTDPGVVAGAGSVLEGSIGSTYGNIPVTVNKPAARTFSNGMKAVGADPNNPMAPLGFISADIFVKGLKLAGPCPTREKFISAMRKVKSYDGAGLLPSPVSFAPGLTPLGTPPSCTWYLTVKNAKLVADSKATCGKFVNTATGQIVNP